MVTVTDRKGRILCVNDAFSRISGYSVEELVGQNHRVLGSGVHNRDFWTEMWRTVSSGSAWHGEVCNRRKNGAVFWVDTTIFPLKDSQGRIEGFLAVRVEITNIHQIRTALVDSLTGLPDRSFLMHRLRMLLQRAAERPNRYYALCFIDIDNFKYVNDSLGHTTGDHLLRETARRLEAAVSSVGSISLAGAVEVDHGSVAARFGGDEFVVLLEDLHSVDDAVAVAEQIKASMTMPVVVGHDQISVQCSIGIATGSGHVGYRDTEALLRDADTAMYQAKALGKNRYALFDEKMHTDVRRRLKLEGELRHAIATGQIETVYQPIVDLESGKVVSFEALARWTHPELGVISPTEFVPVAEETGLIIPLAHTFLSRAAQLLSSLAQLPGGNDLRMNVNVSRRQLTDPHFLQSLEALLSDTGIAPHRLCLEITESTVTASPERILDSLHALKALGVQLHMDDFGTGLSSLSLLRTLPLDGIKIDRSFIEAAEGNREAIAILHAIITLGRNLRKVITAEGLENPTHVATVIGLDCDLVQGWVFGQPVTARDVPAVLGLDFSSHVSYPSHLPGRHD